LDSNIASFTYVGKVYLQLLDCSEKFKASQFFFHTESLNFKAIQV